MKTLCAVLACTAALAMGAVSASADTNAPASVPAPDALTCVFGGPVSVLGHQVVGAFQICVPTP
jgi:hypothetical protein